MTSRPGRPKSEEKHAAILEAAGHCFLRDGLAGTSMDAVAQAAGVSKQTVYSHFRSKEALFEAVISGKCRSYAFEGRAPDRSMDLAEGLRAFTRRYLDLILDPQVIAMTRQVIAQSASHREMAERYRQAGMDRTVAELASFLEHHARAGNLAVEDPRAAAADYVHETGARFRTEMLMNLRESVAPEEREAHIERRVREFLAERRPPPTE